MTLVQRDLAELRAQRDLLLSSAWRWMAPLQRREIVRQFCLGYGVPPATYVVPTAYRAQTNDEGVLFEHVKRLLAPPTDCVKKAGRLNRAGVSTLYVAGTVFASVQEIAAPIGSMVSILACRQRPDSAPFSLAPVATTFHLGSGRIGSYRPDFVAGALGNEDFRRALREAGRLEQWMIHDQTVGQILTMQVAKENEQSLYELTNAIREHIYGTFPGYYDGVQYPSVAVRRTAPNIALDARRWGDIEPLEVWVARVTNDFQSRAFETLVIRQPLLWIGHIQSDGKVLYTKTSKTLLNAVGDFKQRFGRPLPRSGMRPILTEPYRRYRISYGLTPDRSVLDFYPPD